MVAPQSDRSELEPGIYGAGTACAYVCVCSAAVRVRVRVCYMLLAAVKTNIDLGSLSPLLEHRPAPDRGRAMWEEVGYYG